MILKLFLLSILQIFYTKQYPRNNSAITISKYAKVARWGPNTGNFSGQTLFTQRSDVSVTKDQNLQPNFVDMQKRFNPRPYFDYNQVPPKTKQDPYTSYFTSYNPPKISKPTDDVVYPPYASPFDSPKNFSNNDIKMFNVTSKLKFPLIIPDDNSDVLDEPPYEDTEIPLSNGHDLRFLPPDYPQNPHYLYSNDHFYDFDHNHYEQITTSTTKAPEDERVNKGQYSYYYLGRKLWYIPLYFSIYFIIYVTILILKSIARHKIELKHHVHYDRQSRGIEDRKTDQLHKNVTIAIDLAKKKFNYVM